MEIMKRREKLSYPLDDPHRFIRSFTPSIEKIEKKLRRLEKEKEDTERKLNSFTFLQNKMSDKSLSLPKNSISNRTIGLIPTPKPKPIPQKQRPFVFGLAPIRAPNRSLHLIRAASKPSTQIKFSIEKDHLLGSDSLEKLQKIEDVSTYAFANKKPSLLPLVDRKFTDSLGKAGRKKKSRKKSAPLFLQSKPMAESENLEKLKNLTKDESQNASTQMPNMSIIKKVHSLKSKKGEKTKNKMTNQPKSSKKLEETQNINELLVSELPAEMKKEQGDALDLETFMIEDEIKEKSRLKTRLSFTPMNFTIKY